jgi:hypothetical protein
VDQIVGYLGLGLYYGLFLAFIVCYIVLLGHLLWNKQWLIVLLSVFFAVIFAPAGPFIALGPAIALVIGWQEAGKWKITNLMRLFSALWVVCFLLLTRDAYINFMNPPPKVDPKVEARLKAQQAAQKALQKGGPPKMK